MTKLSRIGRRVSWTLGTLRHVNQMLRQSPEDRRYLTTSYDNSTPLPKSADKLTSTNERLVELKKRYARLDLPVTRHFQWGEKSTAFIGDHMQYFRGDTPFLWHYRDAPKVTRLKYFTFLEYIRKIDNKNLLETLSEDGAFGCWHFQYPDRPVVSRDLLDSINEILFLDRELRISERDNLRVLDIGAGYGRLAHRMLAALPNIEEYCCVDAIPESTFLCEYYLQHRDLFDRARVVALDEIEKNLSVSAFDIAFNIHSFSECKLEAVSWWIDTINRLRIPYIFIVPNQPESLLTTEGDGKKLDFRPVLEDAGYRLKHFEPVFADPAVQEMIDVYDHFFLFEKNWES